MTHDHIATVYPPPYRYEHDDPISYKVFAGDGRLMFTGRAYTDTISDMQNFWRHTIDLLNTDYGYVKDPDTGLWTKPETPSE
jgi:hypothetical protein